MNSAFRVTGFQAWGLERGPQGVHMGASHMVNNCYGFGRSHFEMMHSGFKPHDRPPFHHPAMLEFQNRGFNQNAGWEREFAVPFWEDHFQGAEQQHAEFARPYSQEAPAMLVKNFQRHRKRKKTMNLLQVTKNSSSEPAKKKQDNTTKTNEAAKEPAKPIVMKPKVDVQKPKVDAPNKNAKKPEPVKKKDEVNHQPNKKLKPEETATPTQQTNSVSNLHNTLAMNRDSRTTFSCPLCRFHTSDPVELEWHFYSAPHKDILKHLYIFLPSKRVDFIQEYLVYQASRVAKEQKRLNLRPIKDSFPGIGQEHFLHRVEVAHCQACDTLVPDVPQLLSDHIKLESHIKNCNMIKKDITSKSLSAAKNILKDTKNLKLLEKYNKGINPFVDAAEDAAAAVTSCEDLVAEEDEDHVASDDGNVDTEVNHIDTDSDDDEKVPGQGTASHSAPETKEPAQPRHDNGLLHVDGPMMTEEEEEEAEEAAEAP